MQDNVPQAIYAWAAAETIRKTILAPVPPIEYDIYEQTMSKAKASIDERQFQMLWLEGQQMTPAQVLSLEKQSHESATTTAVPEAVTQAVTQAPMTTPPPPPPAPLFTEELTGRELEVLRYLARGLTSVKIADELCISPRTVQAHLRSIYSKIGVATRSAATRYAIEHRLT
jgi:DNA-binding NarL/FixJ family response regulator